MANHPRTARTVLLAASVVGALALAIPSGLQPAAQEKAAIATPNDFTALAKPLLPAVVNISSSILAPGPEVAMPGRLPPQLEEFFRHFFGPEGALPDRQRPRGTALGSGFIIDPSGFVVTNNHVVENAESTSVVLHDGSEYQAKLIGRDPHTDLALLKIDADRRLAHVRWGDSERVEVGEWVLAVGNPFGLGGSVTAGIVSALARSIGAGPYDDFLQTDASINQGNSGGPMFNMRGEVIGISTAIFSPTGGNIGIGFAIPSSLARPIIEQLRSTGEVRRGWLGVTIQPVTPEIAASLGLDKPQGVLVAEVTEGGPADRAGIEVGDVLLSYQGAPIGERSRLPLLVARSEIGSSVEIVVWRDGRRRPIPVRIGNLSEAPGTTAEADIPEAPPAGEAALGLALAPLTPAVRAQLGIEDGVRGVVVTNVLPNSPADRQGIMAGDVILRIGPQSVDDPAEAGRLLAQARQSDRPVLLLIRRGEDNRFVTLPSGTG